jgi:hypothetical protein
MNMRRMKKPWVRNSCGALARILGGIINKDNIRNGIKYNSDYMSSHKK